MFNARCITVCMWCFSLLMFAAGGCGSAKHKDGTGTIGLEGGAVTLTGGPSVEIPAGALWSSVTLTIATSSAQPPIAALTHVFQFGPEGTAFKLPITVSFTVPAGTTSASMYWTALGSADEYEMLPTTISGTTVTAQVTHFSAGFVATRSCKEDADCAAGACNAESNPTGPCIKNKPGCCAGSCVDLNADDKNCGFCNHICLPNEACGAGVCVCTGIECHLVCIDTVTDPGNCGGCDQACDAGVPCCGGSCCPPGNACCFGPIIDQVNGTCVNLASDVHNCGRCGGDCIAFNGPDWVCVNGTCSCPSSKPTQCQTNCVDVQTDAQNCGSCGHACDSGESCAGGACQSCLSGQEKCAGVCTDTHTDSQNCGSCGHACSDAQTCSNGNCQCPPQQLWDGSTAVVLACGDTCVVCGPLSSPDPQYTCCDGVCKAVAVDPAHCGSCEKSCPPPGTDHGIACCAGSCTEIYVQSDERCIGQHRTCGCVF